MLPDGLVRRRRAAAVGAGAALALVASLTVALVVDDRNDAVTATVPAVDAATDAPTRSEPAPSAERAGAPRAGADGIGDPYWPLDGNGGIDIVHYDVRDAYDFDRGLLTGSTTLTVRATQSLSSFSLDLLLPVSAVRVDGVAASFHKPGRIDRDHELRIRPRSPLSRGERFTVRVDYGGRPGAVAYAGERNWLADDREVVTMNEPHMAPWWFPANDHPSDKARFDITITGPRTHQVVSNGLLVDRTVSERDDTATTHWRSTSPMATYLAYVALGRYDVARSSRDGLPSYVAVSRELGDRQRRASMRLMRRSAGITAYLTRRLGAPYPFESSGGLTTSLPVGFALENQTRPTYPAQFDGGVNLIVHELAHQWFGDSVSVRRWRDIWLNEGFAAFMEHVYREDHGGIPARQWLRETRANLSDSADYWRLPIDDPGPVRLFDAQVYERGAMAVQALRDRLGEDAFWTTMRQWVTCHRGDSAGVGDFRRLAEEVSGEQLDGFFDAWLSAPRPPAVTRANGLA